MSSTYRRMCAFSACSWLAGERAAAHRSGGARIVVIRVVGVGWVGGSLVWWRDGRGVGRSEFGGVGGRDRDDGGAELFGELVGVRQPPLAPDLGERGLDQPSQRRGEERAPDAEELAAGQQREDRDGRMHA